MAPLRVKSRSQQGADGPRTPSPFGRRFEFDGLPDIELDDSFRDVIKKLAIFIADAVTLPCTFEQLRTTSAGDRLRTLVVHLSNTCDNPCIVNALLALKWHYGAANEDRGLSEARANACEIVAWRFLTHLSEREAVDFCLYEIPGTKRAPGGVAAAAAAQVQQSDSGGGGGQRVSRAATRQDEEQSSGAGNGNGNGSGRGTHSRGGSHDYSDGIDGVDENSPLLSRFWASAMSDPSRQTTRRTAAGSTRRNQLLQSISRLTMSMSYDHGSGDDGTSSHSSDFDDDDEDDPTAPFVNLNALEIAAIADAKRFLGQNVVQKIITGIWNGDIIFWDRLEVGAVKKPRFYNPHTADPFSRLRVPKYLKSFEIIYFLALLTTFYLTLLDRNPTRVSTIEVVFYILMTAFAYDELSEWIDAGSIFYVYDFWNVVDVIIIVIGVAFFALRIVGLSRGDAYLIDLSFDILSLQALFMVPRISSILSLSPYWGTLIPCFKEMTKDFIKFMVLVVILYLGFLTTFSLIGRDKFTLPHMTMILTKIFFGSSYVGFDIMDDIDPVFGPPLMLVFVTLSSILLMGSLTGMLSNSFSRVMGHAREEYLYVYSIYVLEASTSNRLTHFYPPFNLIALVIFRPLRLFLPSDHKFRAARIALLKATHLPIVGAIQLYEVIYSRIPYSGEDYSPIRGPRQQTPALTSSTGNIGSSGHSGVSGDSSGVGLTPKKIVASPPLRVRSSSSSHRHHTQRPLSTSDLVPRLAAPHQGLTSPTMASAAGVNMMVSAAVEDTGMDAPSDVEIRIAELTAKIDKLTELVLQMHAQQNAS